jgi:hypothetical protein
MAEKSAKKKPKKAAKASADPSVLGSLRATRPSRLGGDRRRTTRPASAAAAKQAAATKPSAAKTSTASKSSAAAKSSAAPKAKAAAKPKATKARIRPQPTPPAAPPAGWQVPDDGDGRRDGGPAELVKTGVQAAGELAQIGLTVGGQLLKRAAGRLPRP